MPPQVIAKNVQAMFGAIAERYDLTNTVLSGGIHHLWKRSVVKSLPLGSNARILDLCTGTGDLLPLLRQRFASVIGADFSLPMLQVGQSRPGHAGLPIVQGDALRLPFADGSFDGITVAFGVRNLEVLTAGLQEMSRVLRPGGTVVILEFGQPPGKIFGALYRWYSRWLMPIIGGSLTGNKEAYSYLPETAAAFPSGQKFVDIMAQCGYKQASVRAVTFGIAYLYTARVNKAG